MSHGNRRSWEKDWSTIHLGHNTEASLGRIMITAYVVVVIAVLSTLFG